MGDKEVQGCARKCVATCVRGGGGKMQRHLSSTKLEGDKAAAAMLTSCFGVRTVGMGVSHIVTSLHMSTAARSCRRVIPH